MLDGRLDNILEGTSPTQSWYHKVSFIKLISQTVKTQRAKSRGATMAISILCFRIKKKGK
jgi:hypothetical protein